MARCFPYPPPEGYLGNGACGGRSLLGPIKPNVETEKTGNGRKATETCLKRKGSRRGIEEEAQSKKIKLTKRSGGSSGMGKAEEAESSGVTEEHGLPVCSQSPSHSSDSVKGCTKRIGSESATITANPPEKKRNLIRIKLKTLKPEQPCVVSSSAAQQKVVDHTICAAQQKVVDSTISAAQQKAVEQTVLPDKQKAADHTQCPVQQKIVDPTLRAAKQKVQQKAVDRAQQKIVDPTLPPAKQEVQQKVVRCAQQKAVDRAVCSPDGVASTSAPDVDKKLEDDIFTKVGTTAINISRDGKKLSVHKLYDSITNGWTPPELLTGRSETEVDDWLLPAKKPASSEGRQVNKGSCNAIACTTWPRAQFLPGADVYALPYTVPF